MTDFGESIRRHTEEAEEIIRGYLPAEEGPQKTVLSAMNYSFLAGGKRLRPMLMLETYRLFGGTDPVIFPFMAAIEMIHTYSLIHDDLPAMDNDEYRRGQKTAWVVYGEAMAILAGDGLLNLAYETAAKAALEASDHEKALRALCVLTKKAGVYGMVGGQTADVENEGKQFGLPVLEFIHRHKTSALIESAMLIGAILAGASGRECDQIEQAAGDIGLAFQIRDDILDVIGEEATLGKPVGSDEKNDHVTYVSLRGLDQARRDVEEISGRALDVLAALPYENPFLTELVRALITRDY